MKWLPVLPFLIFAACSDAPPSPELVGLQLSVEDVSCAEAWLRIRSSNSKGTISLVRDVKTLMAFSASVVDTLVMDKGLAPGRSYTYQASRMGGGIGSAIELSEAVSVRTLDTTSHDFSWRITQLGDGGSSFLHDIAIINDTLSYACGAIYQRDSVGNIDPDAYNLVKWSGSAWTPMRIQFYTICGQSGRTPYPARSVHASGGDDVWIASAGSQVARWNGSSQTATLCLPVSFLINRLWGENPNSIYAVGDGGNTLHYASGTWQKSETGTTISLRDITGDISGKPVWACGYSNDLSQSALLTHDGQSWQTVWTRGGGSTPPYGDLVSSVAVVGRSLYVTSNLGVFRRSITETSADAQRLLSLGSFAYRIRGSSANNIFVVGDYTRIWHYNGLTWKLLNDGVPARPLYGLAVSENLVVAVGADYSTIPARAVIYTGRR